MLNKVMLIGNLGADPDVRELDSGDLVCNLSLATTERWKDRDGEDQERTEWHRITAWGDRLCETLEEYLEKGSRIYVEGQLQTRSYEKDEVTHYQTEIVVRGFRGRIQFLNTGGGNGGRQKP